MFGVIQPNAGVVCAEARSATSWLAGTAPPRHSRGDAVAIRELIQVWRVGTAHDLVIAVVLHDDEEDVVERRHG